MTKVYYPIIRRKLLPERLRKKPSTYSMSEMAEYVSVYALPGAAPELRQRVLEAHAAHLTANKTDATRHGVNKRHWAIVQQPLRYAMAKAKKSLDRFCQVYGPNSPEAEAYRAYWQFLTMLDAHIAALREKDPALTPKEAIAQYNATRPEDKPEIEDWRCWIDWARMKPKAMHVLYEAFASIPYRHKAKRFVPFVKEGYMTHTLKLRLRYDPDAPAPNSKEAREATMRLVKPEPATLDDVLTAITPEEKPKLEIPADVQALWGGTPKQKPAVTDKEKQEALRAAQEQAARLEEELWAKMQQDEPTKSKMKAIAARWADEDDQQTKEYDNDDK